MKSRTLRHGLFVSFDLIGKFAYSFRPFSNDYGVSGHVARATITGIPKSKSKNGCESTDGKAVAVSFENSEGEKVTWVLLSDVGVKDEIPDSTIDKITSSLRPIE